MSRRLARGLALIAALFTPFTLLALAGCARAPSSSRGAAAPCNCEAAPGVTHHPSGRTTVAR